MIKLTFKQKSKNKLSNFEIISFCSSIISINYRIELLNGLTKLILNGYKAECFLIVNNKNNILIDQNLDLTKERDVKLFRRLGDFKSIYPNITILELKLILEFFSQNSRLLKVINGKFDRDWSLKNIYKIYFEDGFEIAMNYTKSIFTKEIRQSSSLLRTIEKSFEKIITERNLNLTEYKNKKRNYIDQQLKNSLRNIVHYEYPIVMYFDNDENVLKTFSFNNFESDYGFDICKISHESPWEIDILTLPDNPIYLLVMSIFALPISIVTLINLNYSIKKNKADLKKMDAEKQKEFITKTKDFIKYISSNNKDLLTVFRNLRKIKNKDLCNELIEIYSELVAEFNYKIKKVEMRIIVDGVVQN